MARTIRRGGAVTVEMSLVAPLLIFLFFGIIEFGLTVKDLVGLNQAAREGARCAAVGATPTAIDTRIANSAPTIDTGEFSALYEYRSYDADTGWGEWTVLGINEYGDENNAGVGDQIRIRLQYPHHLVTGRLFASLADDPEQCTITLSTAIVMRRE